MLFPTLASGVFLALFGAPSVLAIQDLPLAYDVLPKPAPTLSIIQHKELHERFDGAPGLSNLLSSLGSDSMAIGPHDGDDDPFVPLRPTRVRRTPAAFEQINPTDVPTRLLAHNDNPPRARALTNAQLLARGLPPRSPRLNRHRSRAAHAHAHAPRQSPKPCTNPTGTLMMMGVDSPSATPFGPVGRMANSFGEYGLEPGSQPLEVVLRQCDAAGLPFEIETSNGLSDFPFFGGIMGFASADDNISDANSNYVYIGGTTEVSFGPAQDAKNGYSAASGTERDVESALWTLADGALTMHWSNTDGTPAQGAHILYVPSADALVLTGNVDLFRARFGPAPEVVLTFVPSP